MPYSVGVEAAVGAFVSAGFPIVFVSGLAVLLLILCTLNSFQNEAPDSAPSLPGFSLFAIYPFFRQRFDFLNWGFYATRSSIFKFKLLRNTVIVVSGESARDTFFTARGLDLTEGFKILSGAIPMVKGVTSDLQTKRIALIHKRLAAMQRNAPLSQLIPAILEDTRRKMESWGTDGTFDPFDRVYELIFQTTVRCLSCSEIADDPTVVARLKILYDKLDTGTTPATVLLPWLPTPSMIKKLWATKDIYDIIDRAIKTREESGVYRYDALQMLLDSGDEKLVIIGFIMGLLIAGARATGTSASWVTIYLSGHPEWRRKTAQEVELLLSTYSPVPLSSLPSAHPHNAGGSLERRLTSVPLEAWELETPVMDSIIRETLRIAQPHSAMRRNIGPDMYIDGNIIPSGAYVVYPFSDVHLDDTIFPEPWRFDPGRPAPLKEIPFSWVGWGGGKTTCLGTRLAKAELKLLIAMFVVGFRSSIVDSKGNPTNIPSPNWNDIFLCRPAKRSFNIRYEKTNVQL